MPASGVSIEYEVARLRAYLPFLANMDENAGAQLAAALRLQEATSGVDPRLLLRRILLHLPRFDNAELNDTTIIQQEVERRAAELSYIRGKLPENLASPRAPTSFAASVFQQVDAGLAGLVHRSWHYLATPRRGMHFGLYTQRGGRPEDLMCLATLSHLDVPHLTAILPNGNSSSSTLMLSRIVAANGVPQNTITYMMGRLFAWLKQNKPDIRLLLTYLNQNLGFEGSIYKASNWLVFAREPKQQLFYVDGNYATDREIIERFGTNNPAVLGLRGDCNRERLSASRQPLLPLDVLVYFIDSSERTRASAEPRIHDLTPIPIK